RRCTLPGGQGHPFHRSAFAQAQKNTRDKVRGPLNREAPGVDGEISPGAEVCLPQRALASDLRGRAPARGQAPRPATNAVATKTLPAAICDCWRYIIS